MFDMQNFSKNFKRIRKEKNISQLDLATALNISPQSVSKWECAKSVPDVANLCLIAAFLDTSIDNLLGVKTSKSKLMIGVDGGGTKTEFILFNQDGLILARKILGATNPNVVGIDACVETLNSGIQTLLSTRNDASSIFIGCAGFYTFGERVKERLTKLYPTTKIECKSDIMGVIASATEEENCIATISGTGTVVYTKKKDELKSYAWWGYLLNKHGSGYDIGRDAISLALSSQEGLGKKTELEYLIEQTAEMPLAKVVETVYQKGTSYIASFVPTVINAVRAGDEVATKILEDNAYSLADTINVIAKRDNLKTVIASGSMFTNVKEFVEIFKRRLSSSNLTLVIPALPQSLGTCFLSAKLSEVYSDELRKNLIKNFMEKNNK